MRDLASVCTVDQEIAMDGKDRIHCITMVENGYEVIVPKEIKHGDKIIFIQEGSILPEESCWEFLRKRCYREDLKGFLIKPMTMGKKVDGTRVKSWGLAVSFEDIGLKKDLAAGTDVTDLLKIRKYETTLEDASPTKGKIPPFIKFCYAHKPLRWIARMWQDYKMKHKGNGAFPSSYIDKSDETTIQNCKAVLERFKDKGGYTSVKLEGMSATYMLDPTSKKHDFIYCSRNNAYKGVDESNVYYQAAVKHNIEKVLRILLEKTGRFYIFQGEICGPKIQENIYHLDECRFFMYALKYFDKNTNEKVQLGLESIIEICETYNLERVPVIEVFDKLSDIMPNVEAAVAYAEKSCFKIENGVPNWKYVPKDGEKLWVDYSQNEGVVVRTAGYDKMKNNGCSFKVKNLGYQEASLGKISKIIWR